MIPVTVDVRVHTRSEEEIAEIRRRFEEQGGAWREQDLSKQHVLVLREAGGHRALAIWCGAHEATAIRWALDGVETERPMTHDMLRDVVQAMGAPKEVRITGLRETTFYAELVVMDRSESEQTISCRPSDGIALAVRAQIPILVTEELLLEPPASASA